MCTKINEEREEKRRKRFRMHETISTRYQSTETRPSTRWVALSRFFPTQPGTTTTSNSIAAAALPDRTSVPAVGRAGSFTAGPPRSRRSLLRAAAPLSSRTGRACPLHLWDSSFIKSRVKSHLSFSPLESMHQTIIE